MTALLKRILAPPVFEGDEEKTRIARLNHIYLVVAAFLLTLRAIGILGPFPETAPLLGIYVCIILVCLALLRLLRRGRVRLVAYLTAFVSWLGINSAAVLVGGVDRPMFANNLILLVFIAFTLGVRPTAGFALASGLAGVGMLWAKLNGYLATPTFATDLSVGATTQLINVAAAGIYLGVAAHNLQEALGQARQSARLLAERNRALNTEIAEHKRAEEALLESEERFQSLSRAAFEGIMIHDQGVILDANQAFADLFGFHHPEDLIGRNGLELPFTPESLELIKANIRSGSTESLDIAVVRRDGSIFPAETQGRDIAYKGRHARVVAMRDTTERKRVEAELQHRANEFAALYETARNLAAQTALPDLLQTLAQRAAALLGAPNAAIALYDAVRGSLEVVAAVGPDLAIGTQRPLGLGLAGRVAQTRQPLRVDNYSTWEGRSPQYAGIPYAAMLGVPMSHAGELIGVLDVSELAPSTRTFTEADEHLLSLLAGQAASAVRNARLLEETRRRLAELEAVNRISTALRAAQTLDTMLSRLLDETLAMMDSQAGAIWLYDAPSGELHSVVARGWFTPLYEEPVKPGEGIAGTVFATGQAYLSHEFAADPQTREATRSQIPPGWGGACIPIRTAAETVGVLFISVPVLRKFKPAEMHLLTAITDIAGNAIHRMRLHGQTEQHLRRLSALHTVDLAITSSLDLSTTLNVLLDQTITQLCVDAADVLMLNVHTQALEYAAGRGFRSEAITRVHLRLGGGQAGYAALERRTVVIPNFREASGDLAREMLLAGEDFQTYFGIPLIAKGQLKGVLELFYRVPLSPDPAWQDFLETLAGQAAIAIDDAELFANLQSANVELTVAYDATIEGWSHALELRDQETQGHTERVTETTVQLARRMGLSDAELVHIRRGALLHDIGKMGIPDGILLKPGLLTEAEWAIMRQHPTYAYEMLSPITYLHPALDIPYCHHEKWDGSGYPRGLKGEAIPLAARIFAVVDVWDALRSDRPYRAAWPEEKVCEHIRSLAGTHFDSRVVEVFLRDSREAEVTRGE